MDSIISISEALNTQANLKYQNGSFEESIELYSSAYEGLCHHDETIR